MRQLRFILAWCIYLLLTGFSNGSETATTSPQATLTLSDEALRAARHNRVIELSQHFLDNNINSNTCSGTLLTGHLRNLQQAYEALGRTEDYYRYCKQLYDSVDRRRMSTLLRTFYAIVYSLNGNMEAAAMPRYSFSLYGDNDRARTFFEDNIDMLLTNLPPDKPLLALWLHIVYSDILAYGRDFDSAEAQLAKAHAILNEKLAADRQAALLVGLAEELLLARRNDWLQAAEAAQKNKAMIETINPASKEWHAVNERLITYLTKMGSFDKLADLAGDGTIRQAVFDAAPAIFKFGSLEGADFVNSPGRLIAGRNEYLARINAANANFANNNTAQAGRDAAKVLYTLQKEIATDYSKFAFNRADDVLKSKVDMLVETAPALAVKNSADTLLQQLAYNAALIYKQLSISSGDLYRKLVTQLGNDALLKRYAELANARIQLDSIAPRAADSLLHRISVLESYLQRNLEARSNVYPSTLPTWRDVQTRLNPECAAVEFMVSDADGHGRYIASIVTPGASAPVAIDLCAADDINTLKNCFGNDSIYCLLWQPIIKSLPAGVSTIYFAPAGQLNIMPIEYAASDTGTPLSDSFNLNRLSSTHRIAHKTNTASANDIILYGGVKYQLDNSEIATNEAAVRAANLSADDQFTSDTQEFAHNHTRAGIEYLPGTVSEVEGIARLYNQHGAHSTIKQGAQASELSFKELSGRNVPLIHLATHGFAMTRKARSRLGRLLARNDSRSTFEEQSLGRAGLMLAGAANTIDSKNKTATNGIDDGILTAREISRMNLAQTNMVVLSACESGLGEIDTEGVAGLQRGLKRAGVETILMSLRKVDDQATAILMQEFYKNLLSGNNATESLRKAQQHLRTAHNARFDHPDYWGAFILLDAI